MTVNRNISSASLEATTALPDSWFNQKQLQKITTALFVDAEGAWAEHCRKRQLERSTVTVSVILIALEVRLKVPKFKASLLFIFRWQPGINEALPLTLEKVGKIKGN